MLRINSLKTTYQRNMIMGQALVIGAVSLFIAICYFMSDTYVRIDGNRIVNIEAVNRTESFVLPSVSIISKQDAINTSKINKDKGIYKPISINNNTLDNKNMYELAAGVNDMGILEELGNRQYTGIGNDLNCSDGAWPLQNEYKMLGSYSLGANFRNMSKLKMKESLPLLIDFAKPIYPRQLRYTTDASVTIGFYISNKGWIKRIDVLNEDPVDCGFAISVKEALRNSWIEAAVVNGKKTGGYYKLTYEFCEECPATPVVTKSTNNISVSIK